MMGSIQESLCIFSWSISPLLISQNSNQKKYFFCTGMTKINCLGVALCLAGAGMQS